MTHIAFIGLGAMGSGMAASLVRAGRSVVAYDLSTPALERAETSGCRVAASVAEAVGEAQVVITMLPAARQVREVYDDHVASHAGKGALMIDCSTIDVASARSVGDAMRALGLRFADAPVSGGVAAAAAGALTFMVGGPAEDFTAVEAALAPMAGAVLRAGEAGAGQAAKICNNMLLGVSMLGLCEAFALAEKLGLEAERFFEIASRSSGRCWSLDQYSPWPGLVAGAPSNRDYEGGFLTSLMSKDLKLAQAAAAACGVATPMGAQAQALYALFEGLGYGQRDFSAVLQLMRGRLTDL